ncbi:DnaA ATPase domain-containing protein, partial [Dermacoccus nishinomiyaensis]
MHFLHPNHHTHHHFFHTFNPLHSTPKHIVLTSH